jgi:hypothetical protein
MKELQLSLKKQWFRMTESLIKKEDYRSITPYWCNRFLLYDGKVLSKENWRVFLLTSVPVFLSKIIDKEISNHSYKITTKQFKTNTMTLGYPKSTDIERVLIFEHQGIEIRTGNPEWGAVEGRLYFVIKHGKRIQ